MATKNKKVQAVKALLDGMMHEIAFVKKRTYEECTGVVHDVYSRDHPNGEVVLAIGCAYSNSRNLFISAKIGLNVPLLIDLLDDVKLGLSRDLANNQILLSWGISDTCAEGFDPSPERPGTEFVLSDPLESSELQFLQLKVPLWINQVEAYLHARPLYDFYKYHNYIDQSGRWREMVAILKILAGERYVGNQLLLDLKAEAAGERPPMGTEWWAKVYVLKKNEAEHAFQTELYSAVHAADGKGIYGATSTFNDARSKFEW